jgi:hypothetical protein
MDIMKNGFKTSSTNQLMVCMTPGFAAMRKEKYVLPGHDDNLLEGQMEK